MNKLARQLRREATANPKKAAILAVLLLVASYYWGPLVWGWVAPGQVSGEPPADAADTNAEAGVLADAASTQPQAPPVEEACSYPWTQLDEWMRHDPMTTPSEDVSGWRDPFALASVGAGVDGQEGDQTDAPQVTPESLGMELTGTLVGPRRRVAIIGGKAYREGQTVKIDHGDRPIELRLVEVHPRRIVLEWEGNRFDLVIPERKTDARIEPAGQTP